MNIIVATSSDWGIGINGSQTIVIPDDRDFFKRTTAGGVIIYGRKTYEEIGKPLPDRKNILLTRDSDYSADGCIIANTVDEAFSEIAGDDPDKVFVIGGGEIYNAFLPFCIRAYVTKIEAAPMSDTFFPNLDALSNWSIERRSIKYESDGISYSIIIYRNDDLWGGSQYTRG